MSANSTSSTKFECSENLCSSCGKSARNYCAAFQDAPSDDHGKRKSTWYCIKACQTKDCAHHKPTCKSLAARKTLYRAAETAQALFYVYREVAFDKLYAKVERTGSELVLYEGYYEEVSDACGYMDVVLKTMLEGISIKLLDASAKVKARNPLTIRLFGQNGKEDLSEYQHQVLLVTLKDASVYVVDLSGAQYGYHEPVMPRKLYEESRAVQILLDKSHAFGWQRQRMKEACTANSGPESAWGGVVFRCNEPLYQCFNDNVSIWQRRFCMPLPTMLKGNDKDFRNNQSALVTFVEASLCEYKRLADARGKFKAVVVPYNPVPPHAENAKP